MDAFVVLHVSDPYNNTRLDVGVKDLQLSRNTDVFRGPNIFSMINAVLALPIAVGAA